MIMDHHGGEVFPDHAEPPHRHLLKHVEQKGPSHDLTKNDQDHLHKSILQHELSSIWNQVESAQLKYLHKEWRVGT
jgi:hypothetical protein